MIQPHPLCVGILVLGLAIVAPGPLGQAAPLPAPKKMTLPKTVSRYLASLQDYLEQKIKRLGRTPGESVFVVNAKFDYYNDAIICLLGHLESSSRWPLDGPLTTEERRGLRDLLYRLQREMAEGQANGTIGHESLNKAYQRHRDTQKKKN
jgi:hypothetical protein